jgi:Secretion system C-terminal sorting domain
MKKLLLSTNFIIFFCNLFSQINATVGFGLIMKHQPKYFGLNCANVSGYEGGLQQPYLVSNLAEMGITTGRVMGGTYSMFWDWETGKLLTKKRLLHGYSPPNFNSFMPEPANTIKVFRDVVGGQVADMVFDLNVLTSSYNQQRAGILYTKLIGQRLRGVEMGNEFYNQGLSAGGKDHQEFVYNFSSAESYADTANRWIDSLRTTFGNSSKLPIAVVGSDQVLDNGNNNGEVERINDWTKIVMAKVQWGPDDANAITIHPYTGSAYPDSVMGTDTSKMNRFLYRPDYSFNVLQARDLNTIRTNPNIKVWFTEYGLYDKTHEVHATWAQGLFTARQTLSYLNDTLVELVDVHSMLGNATWSCIFADANGFDLTVGFNDNFDEPGTENDEDDDSPLNGGINYTSIAGEKTAVGNTLNLVSQAMRYTKQRTKMNFNGVNITVPYGLGNNLATTKLTGWKFSGFYNRNYIIVNSSKDSIAIPQSQIFAGESNISTRNYTMITDNPLDYVRGNAVNTSVIPPISLATVNNAHVPYKKTGSLNGTGNLVILPYSVTLIKVVLFDVPCCNGTDNFILSSYEDNKAVKAGTAGYLKILEGTGPYTWTSNNGSATGGNVSTNTGTTDNLKIIPYNNTTTNKFITYTVADAGTGRTNSITLTVLPKKLFEIKQGTIAVDTVTTCDNDCVTLTVTDIDVSYTDNRYQWYTVDGSLSNSGGRKTVTICPKEQNKMYYVIGYSGAGSTQIYSIDSVRVISKAWAEARPSKIEPNDYNVYICNDGIDTVKLGTPAIVPNLYAWTGPNGYTNNTAQPIVTNGGLYTLTVTGNGCTETSSIDVQSQACCTTAVQSLRFKAYTPLSVVAQAINAICDTCVVGKTIKNFDNIVNFNGPIISDGKYTIFGCDNFTFAQNADFRVRNQNTVIIDNSILNHCAGKKWKSVNTATAQEELIVQNSQIKNSSDGLILRNNALFTIYNNTFDLNQTSLQFFSYGGNMQGVWKNTFNISGPLFAPSSTLHRHIALANCPGYIIIGKNLDSANTFQFTYNASAAVKNAITVTNSGVKATENIFRNFWRAISIINVKTYHQVEITKNRMLSNYKYTTDNNTGTYNIGIYTANTASVTPLKFLIEANIFDSCRTSIYLSKIDNAVISNNTITLRKPASGTIYNHRALYILESFNDTIKINTFRTDSVTFNSLSATDKAKYTGADLQLFQSGSITDNDIKIFSKHINFNSTSTNNRVICNYFTRGLATSDLVTPTYTFSLLDANLNGTYFGGLISGITYSADNYWNNFPVNNICYRFAGSLAFDAPSINYKYRDFDNSTNKYRPKPFEGVLVESTPNATINNLCDAGIGGNNALLVLNDENNPNHSENDLEKSGEGDSTFVDIIENYEPIFDSTSVPTDYFIDMANYNTGLAYANEGIIDSAIVEQNFLGTITGSIILLNEALAMGDSASAANVLASLPRDIEMIDNLRIVTNIMLKNQKPTLQDSTSLITYAYMRVSEGGPATVMSRNKLEIIVDESILPKKSNKTRKNNQSSFWASIHPNPSKGELIFNTIEEEVLKLEMYDATGKLIYENKEVKDQTMIDFSALKSGLYSVILRNVNGYNAFKWVISK